MLLVPPHTQNPPAQAQVLGPVQAAVQPVPAVLVGSLVVWVPAQDPDPRAPEWSWTRSVEASRLRNRGTVGTDTRKGAAQMRVQVLALDLVVVPVSGRVLAVASVPVVAAVPASDLALDPVLVPASVPAWAGTQR